ncbi:MAG: malate dehydrogenase [Nitrososphaerota archaeon]|jgi:malate dehydrogenase|nr:malate dehydrogenase [Nitrososphaerota archaeon]
MITIVGTGRVGGSIAFHLALRELDDIMLLDIVPNLPQGEALDFAHMCATLGIDVDVRGSNDYKDMNGSDIVVVPAGFARKADMTRLDLLRKNADVIRAVGKNIAEYAPNAKVILTTNPLDVMTYLMVKATGFDRHRVMGFSGPLDTGRFKYMIAKELGVSTSSIQTMVIGEHGDSMVLMPRLTTVGGKPLTELLSQQRIGELMDASKKGGAEIIRLRGWSSSYAPGAGVAQMVESVMKDRNQVIPTSVYLQGEYGVNDLAIVVPAVLGRNGVEKVIELQLTEEERNAFDKSVQVLKGAVSQLQQ